MLIQHRCGVLGEVLWDGNHRVVLPPLQTVLGLFGGNKFPLQRVVGLQVLDRLVTNIHLASLIFNRDVFIDNRDWQVLRIPIGVPYGLQEEDTVQEGDHTDHQGRNQQDFIVVDVLKLLLDHFPHFSFHLELFSCLLLLRKGVNGLPCEADNLFNGHIIVLALPPVEGT